MTATQPEHRQPTAFEARLYKACCKIRKGRVSTYGELAKALGSSPRAVGQALRRNPFAPEVPCHRVVKSSLDLGGFSGHTGHTNPNVLRKKAMLEAEGVAFDGCRVKDGSFVMHAHDLG